MDIMFNNVYKSYKGRQVLENLNIFFRENKVSLILGVSGVGKTTILRILMGLEDIDRGKIIGVEDKKIGIIFQEDRLCENLSVLSNIKLVCDKYTEEQIKDELGKVNLRDVLYRPVKELSGGMKRRVTILRALLSDWEILIMDEPFKGLDTETKKKVVEYIRANIKNKTTIMVTHNKDDIKYMDIEEEDIKYIM